MILFDEKNDISKKKFTLLIATLGFESRASYISSKITYEQGLCVMLDDRGQDSYKKNEKIFDSLPFKKIDWDKCIEIKTLKDNILSLDCVKNNRNKEVSIAIDISSMTRLMSAKILYALFELLKDGEKYELTMLYAPAKYDDTLVKKHATHNQISAAGPVIEEYAGFSKYNELPLYTVMGIGYEYGRALGALDYLDVSSAILFRPSGTNKKFLEQVNIINDDLLNMVGFENVIDYNLHHPQDIFFKLRSLVASLSKKGRVVMVPFGPKVFHFSCLLVSHSLNLEIPVWRISPGENEEPHDSEASGEIVSMTFKYKEG